MKQPGAGSGRGEWGQRPLAPPDPDSAPTPGPTPTHDPTPDPAKPDPDQVGQTQNDCDGMLGGDSPLSTAGVALGLGLGLELRSRLANPNPNPNPDPNPNPNLESAVTPLARGASGGVRRVAE